MASGKRVAVIGGGIGGLFVTKALLSKGFEVKAYEQASALGEIGAGVYLTPNGVRQLQRVGLGDAVGAAGALVGERSRYFRHDGSEISPVRVADSTGWNATYGMHRADFIEFLAASIPDGIVSLGHRAQSFEQDDSGAAVTFEDGSSVEADIIIAADGIHSTLRSHVWQESEPVFSGTSVYRGLVPRRLLDGWRADEWSMWLGPGKHFLTFPVRSGELINFVGFVPAEDLFKESWTAPGDPNQLRADFAGWDPRIGELLSHVEQTFRWALYDRNPLPTWTKGRLTLLGDAAHAMLPHLGQGANQSIEDGAALATLLEAADPTRIPEALAVYENLRRARVAEVQSGARQNGLRYDSQYADLAQRDTEIRNHQEFRRNLYDYDVVPLAASALGA
ncbi:FAD-dependent monooxygenase [Glaciibacter sp. 2TAF33]|uniref:FAD-dependent monooxygenase n=1 Tax=Glaciibacter sp. 2TAF33 TaxID=3233015 RepID=UPI003F93DD14